MSRRALAHYTARPYTQHRHEYSVAHPNVGDQDPELKNSPIALESDEDTEALREEIEDAAICYFNNETFRNGALVQSGSLMLRCERGIWVPVGSSDPDNP
jgi:Protein of unknown function (DUF1496)